MVPDRPDRRTIDQLLAEWEERWLRSVADQTHDLHVRREVHDEFLEMLEAQGHPDRDIFGAFLHRMYVESQAMAIRRQTDESPRTYSLRRLIGQLEQHRRKFTRDWYVGRWVTGLDPDSPNERDRLAAKLHLDMANHAFEEFVDAPGDNVLGGRRLSEDRDELDAITEDVVRYVNAHIAHVSAEPTGDLVTYDEFRRAIDHLGEMLKRYYLLINQGGLVSASPTIQRDWRGPFRRPLA